MVVNNLINSIIRNFKLDRVLIVLKNGERENNVMRVVISLMICRRREVMSYCGVMVILL